MTTASVPAHPCEYSPEVIEALRGHITAGERIHDPFAGRGNRLAALCDYLGAVYSGTDIEEWRGRNPRVSTGDSTDVDSYPTEPFTVVTSPVYLNKRLADYANGPLISTKVKGRRDYGISLGRALHANNLARHTGRQSRASAYWRLHAQAVKHWGDRVLVNVDNPIGQAWKDMLAEYGYEIRDTIPVATRRYGGLDNAEKRAEFELLIVATRPAA